MTGGRVSSRAIKTVGMASLTAASLALAGAAFLRPAPDVAADSSYTPAPITSPTAAKAVKPLSAVAIKALLASGKEVTVSVLGDSTGDAAGEWVDLWAKHMSATHTVRDFAWDDRRNVYAADPKVIGKGPVLNIWNGSAAGTTGEYALERFGSIQPQKPDLVIYNYGHNNAGSDAVDILSTLNERIAFRWGPTAYAVTLQNPARGTREAQSAKSAAALRAFVAKTGAASIDVPAAIGDIDPTTLLADEVHPNPQGSQIWVDAVIAALG